ncbi:hypothetical protein Dda_7864 [Drechslerella dactyloides]|uniref:Diaminopimelate epimerase-like protein n=1 Tax=Drechslerella dactyloides TaxID=74499 RepID=A0AAD6IUI4_DREDA|nr:hypothetical protein Dda_7864 [Drechslerella dactyloides]
MPRLPYTTLDVFTTTPMTSGNPLAVVAVPPGTSLSKTQEHLIAREFNYSETIFIYTDTASEARPRIAIWTTDQELPFAGHPTVGAAWYLARTGGERYSRAFEVEVPAGVIGVSHGVDGRMKVDVPTKVYLWTTKLSITRAREVVGLPAGADVDVDVFGGSCKDGVPVISLVDGLAFALVEVASLDVLASLSPGGKSLQIDAARDLGAASSTESFIGTYCYVVTGGDAAGGSMSVRTRMFYDGDKEDPATGSAACALASYLALARGGEGLRVEVTQGVEMQRRSEIGVGVTVGGGVVKKVVLEGAAVKVMEGVLIA